MSEEKKRIPDFENIEEMARFWDSHDSTEFAGGKVEEVAYEPKRLVLSVQFEPSDMIALSRAARQLGMDRSTFVRFVVKQFLRSGSANPGPSDMNRLPPGPPGRL